MFEFVSSILSAISAFASISYADGVFTVYVEDIVFDDDYDEVVPDEFDEDALDAVLDALTAHATSVERVEYVADTYSIGDVVVEVSYSSYDV